MDSDWSFWLAQLAGENPETTPGCPWAGFYLLRERRRWADVRGGRRWRVETNHWPTAIWNNNGDWHCVITRASETSHVIDITAIDEGIFSRCCRAAITHDEYLAKVAEIEGART